MSVREMCLVVYVAGWIVSLVVMRLHDMSSFTNDALLALTWPVLLAFWIDGQLTTGGGDG